MMEEIVPKANFNYSYVETVVEFEKTIEKVLTAPRGKAAKTESKLSAFQNYCFEAKNISNTEKYNKEIETIKHLSVRD